MADTISSVTDSNFQAEVIDASNAQPVMVDFWADWCRPCHMLAPTVAEIAQDYVGKLKVVKLNVDENPRTQAIHRVQSIPTLMLTRGPLFLDKVTGALPKEALDSWVDRFV